jgi:hypothetical protein
MIGKSIQSTLKAAEETLRRFPAALLAALLFAGLIITIEQTSIKSEWFPILVRCAMIGGLGISAFTGLVLFCERYHVKQVTRLIFHLVLLALLMTYYFFIPIDIAENDVLFFILLLLISHLFVSAGPFMVNEEINGFWQYNRLLFIRILTSGLYSAVLFGGLALALGAIDQLFPVKIPDYYYLRLFITVSAVFNTWFFLSGAPADIGQLEQVKEYPTGLRVFTQYVLLPLVTVYLVILYAYSLRILLSLNWPQGWVAYLVLGFSIAGILALLLIWPLRGQTGFRWISVFSRFFFIALFPLILLLSLSIYIRVAEYGVTEKRFFVILLSIWLFINALYFLFSQKKHIKFIPMSLAITAFLAGFGPFNAFRVSRNWQKERFVHQLESAGMLDAGSKWMKVDKPDKKIQIELSNTLFYLVNTHGVSSVSDVFPFPVDSIAQLHPGSPYDVCKDLMASRDLEFNMYGGENDFMSSQFSYYLKDQDNPVNVSGFDYSFRLEFYEQKREVEIELDSGLQFKAGLNKALILSFRIDSTVSVLSIDSLLRNWIESKGSNRSDLSFAECTMNMEEGGLRYRFIINSLSGSLDEAQKPEDISQIHALVLVDLPEMKE